jgi:hypothetical protein
MLPQIPNMRTEGKSTDQLVTDLVKYVNLLNEQMQVAFMSIDMSSVNADIPGTTLEDLFKAGALVGPAGPQGLPGKVYKPTVAADGTITWTLTDEGGSTPSPQNIKGAGVPAGGTTGQILRKKSDTDYDTEWVNP